jgi:hypothetical protein
MTEWTTTMAAIRAHRPCDAGWSKLIAHTGLNPKDDETPVSLLTILESNGLDDAWWCLRAVEGRDREIRLFAVWCARQVEHLMTDPRSIAALDVAERFANGQATADELDTAQAAAWAAWAPRAAAWGAAGAVAEDAARAARAARDAARAAAGAAAEAAAWAAWGAAGAVAEDAARAAGAAARAASWEAARAAQAEKFKEMVTGTQ